jgi:hypothetical protein
MRMDVLYHYCPTTTFYSIVEARAVRLSSLSLSNDTLEGKLVARTLATLAEREGLTSRDKEYLQHGLGLFERLVDGLGFCLSEEGDLLSQWRGYAGEAHGVAIGFSRTYLDWLGSLTSFTLQKVRYDPNEHEAEVMPTFVEVKKLIDAGAYSFPTRGLLTMGKDEEFEKETKRVESMYQDVTGNLLTLFTKLFLLKSPAFREEKEWRLLSYLLRGAHDCEYRALADRVIPFRSYELKELNRKPIVKVVLGPKHLTPIAVVQDYLKQRGFYEVVVTRSEASFR